MSESERNERDFFKRISNLSAEKIDKRFDLYSLQINGVDIQISRRDLNYTNIVAKYGNCMITNTANNKRMIVMNECLTDIEILSLMIDHNIK